MVSLELYLKFTKEIILGYIQITQYPKNFLSIDRNCWGSKAWLFIIICYLQGLNSVLPSTVSVNSYRDLKQEKKNPALDSG